MRLLTGAEDAIGKQREVRHEPQGFGIIGGTGSPSAYTLDATSRRRSVRISFLSLTRGIGPKALSQIRAIRVPCVLSDPRISVPFV